MGSFCTWKFSYRASFFGKIITTKIADYINRISSHDWAYVIRRSYTADDRYRRDRAAKNLIFCRIHPEITSWTVFIPVLFSFRYTFEWSVSEAVKINIRRETLKRCFVNNPLTILFHTLFTPRICSIGVFSIYHLTETETRIVIFCKNRRRFKIMMDKNA